MTAGRLHAERRKGRTEAGKTREGAREGARTPVQGRKSHDKQNATGEAPLRALCAGACAGVYARARGCIGKDYTSSGTRAQRAEGGFARTH